MKEKKKFQRYRARPLTCTEKKKKTTNQKTKAYPVR